MMSKSGVRGCVLVGLVPAMFALDLCLPPAEGLPTGVGEALGCSGGPGVAPDRNGWISLGPVLTRNADVPYVPVATDGFFVFRAQVSGLSPEQALAQLRVVVLDAGGSEVAGDVRSLSGSLDFAWVARQPLAIGAQLTAVLATEPASDRPDLGGRFRLDVEGAPTPLPAPEIAFTEWIRFYHGTGERLSCTGPGLGPCSPSVGHFSVPSSVVEQVSAALQWTPPPLSSGVAWDVRVEPGPGQDRDEPGFGNYRVYGESSERYLFRPVFWQQTDRYCVTLVLQDLRTGEERRSDICSEAGLASSADADSLLGRCDEPPNAELTRAWCDLRGAPQPALCKEPPASTSGPEQTEVTAVRGDDLGDDSSPASGCQLGSAGSLSPAGALLGLALAGLRRSGRRRKR